MKRKKTKKGYIINATLLLLALVISNIIVKYTFNLNDYNIILSVFTYPFVYFFANKITKDTSSMKTINILFLVLLIQGIVYYILNLVDNSSISSNVILGSLLAFGISQLFNLLGYTKILKSKKPQYLAVFALYASVLLIDNFIFYIIMDFSIDIVFVYSMIVRLLVASVLSAFNYLDLKK